MTAVPRLLQRSASTVCLLAFISVFAVQLRLTWAMSNETAKNHASHLEASDNGIENIIRDFREHIKKDFPFPLDLASISGVIDAIRHSDGIDDRKMLLEHVLVLLSRLPPGQLLTKLQNATVELLYNDLPHPPNTYIGPEYTYRAADGSNNNIADPNLGKAGTAYSRSVQQVQALPAHGLPDPGLVFDVLLKRQGFVQHPGGLSSLFFSFAALVIHSVFRTSHENVNINETSSYVDLAPLYGNNQEAQNKVRVRDGRGLMYPDVFAEDRLLLLPPAVSVLLVLFNRNHNFIAKRLFEINERGTYVDPDSISSDDPTKNAKLIAQEEDIFQTARLVNCAWFGSVVFSDYFSCILGLVRQGSSWSLNPFGEIRKEDHTLFERGRGNACSVEFNCLYRWHATTSVADEKWTEQIFSKVFPNKPLNEVTPADFRAVAKTLQASEPDVTHWTFGNLTRQDNGTFKDEDLANFLRDATEHPAAAFRARGTPECFRLNEVMGIMQNRAWGVCSLNDFRKFLGLKPYANFLEWNSNPEIAEAAEKLYGEIGNLELYVGLQAEEPKPLIDGAGLCPGYTISRAILSDAIALTRGDRFFTSDYTPFAMTTWGFNDCQRDASGPGFGSMLGRLFLRTLSDQCSANSTYTWFPLITPASMKKYLTNMDMADKYDCVRPTTQRPTVVVENYGAIREILNSDGFRVTGVNRVSSLIDGDGFFLASEDMERARREQREVLRALAGTPELTHKIGEFFYKKTMELIHTRSYAVVGGRTKNIDIVRHVLKCVPIHWVATEVAGIPLKSDENAAGIYTEHELYDILTDIYGYLFLDTDPSKSMTVHERVRTRMNELLEHIKTGLNGNRSRLSLFGLLDHLSQMFMTQVKTDREEFVERFHDMGQSTDRMANSILAIMVGSVIELSQSLVHTVNLYLGEKEAAQIQSLAIKSDVKAEAALQGFAYEAIRLDPPFAGVYRESRGSKPLGVLSVQANDRVFLDVSKAGRDDAIFENSAGAHPDRSRDTYLLGDASARCLGEELTFKIIGKVLSAVFSLDNVRRGPGQSGKLRRFKNGANQAVRWEYLETRGTTPWPTSMVVQYN